MNYVYILLFLRKGGKCDSYLASEEREKEGNVNHNISDNTSGGLSTVYDDLSKAPPCGSSVRNSNGQCEQQVSLPQH